MPAIVCGRVNFKRGRLSGAERRAAILAGRYLFGSTELRVAEMRTELDAKLALRQRVIAGMEQAIAAKEERLRRLWAARLAHQMSQLPPFDDVFLEVPRAVRAADLPMVDG